MLMLALSTFIFSFKFNDEYPFTLEAREDSANARYELGEIYNSGLWQTAVAAASSLIGNALSN